MTALSSVTVRQLIPNADASMYAVTYSKGAAGDGIDVQYSDGISTTANGRFLPIKTIRFVIASDDGAGAEDPSTYSGGRITFSAGTGAGKLLVIGNC
jgi:hypothetical protein